MSTSETTEERTARVIQGTRRSNFEHEGTYRVYGISYPDKSGTASAEQFNKTLIVENVSESYAQKILVKLKLNNKYVTGGIENKGTPPYQHNN